MLRGLTKRNAGDGAARPCSLLASCFNTQLNRASPHIIKTPMMLLRVDAACIVGAVTGLSTCCATCTALRHVHSYGTIPRGQGILQRHTKRKQFNYLTSSCMVSAPKKRSALEMRRRDDRNLARRHNYKEQLLRNVEEKIRFFPPLVTKQIFFPTTKAQNRTLLFRGHRDIGSVTCMRVTCHVLEQLKKSENRPLLLDKMKKLDIVPPTAEEWAKFTDPETGDINIGILYSQWVEEVFHAFCKEALMSSKKRMVLRSLTALRDFVGLNVSDSSCVPSLEDWARTLGPLKETDFAGRSRGNATRREKNEETVSAMRLWGKRHAFNAVSALPLTGQMVLVQDAAQRRTQLVAELQERHLFATKIKHVLYSLDEIMAINSPRFLYSNHLARKFVMAHNGAYYPAFKRTAHKFSHLSKEEKARWFTFGMRHEVQPTTGQKLFVRYCLRDYGITFTEAARRYNRLSDLQRAALCFPFYLPISPSHPSVAAFKRFYHEMCGNYGLLSHTGPNLGNRVFEAAMRKRWYALPAAERVRYEERDRIAEVFPLVKPSTDNAGASSANAAATMIMNEYFTEGDHLQRSSGFDELLASTTAETKDTHAEGKEREGRGEDDNKEEAGAEEQSSREQPMVTTPMEKLPGLHTLKQHLSDSLSVSTHNAGSGGGGSVASPSRRHMREKEPSAHYRGLRVIVM